MRPLDETLGFLLADVSRLMRRAFEERLAGNPLTLAQARALLYVSRNEGVRQVELADLLEIQPMTIARLIDQLAEQGLVERRPDPTDRRAYRIHLTREAAPQLATIQAAGAAVRAEAMRGLSQEEAAMVVSAVKKMRANLAGGQKATEKPSQP